MVSRVEKTLVWELAGLQREAEPVQVGCLGLSLQGQTMAALGQPSGGTWAEVLVLEARLMEEATGN